VRERESTRGGAGLGRGRRRSRLPAEQGARNEEMGLDLKTLGS